MPAPIEHEVDGPVCTEVGAVAAISTAAVTQGQPVVELSFTRPGEPATVVVIDHDAARNLLHELIEATWHGR